MRRHAFLHWLLPIIVLAASPAFAAVGDKPRRIFKPPPAPAVGLRGPLNAPAAPPPLRMQAVTLPPPGSSLAGLASAGFAGPSPIMPLRSVGDPAPICRATCAETRAVCASSDDAGCDSHWIQCVADCSAPVPR